jgi:hypothetical protein
MNRLYIRPENDTREKRGLCSFLFVGGFSIVSLSSRPPTWSEGTLSLSLWFEDSRNGRIKQGIAIE